jgi:hypothetical protein
VNEEDDLKRSLIYDPSTGKLTWAQGTKFAGNEAGHRTKRGHITINRKGKPHQAHRIAWLLYYGSWPVNGIDHIDGDPSNNKISNLRDVGQDLNNKNKCIRMDSSSGVTGVAWCTATNKWRAYISVHGKTRRLGQSASFERAVQLRKAAERKYGYHPNHGRPQ